eukprot:434667_1
MSTDISLDYLDFGGMSSSTEKVILSTKIFKINKRGKRQQRVFLLTNLSIYNIKQNKKRDNNWKRQINLIDVASILFSRKSKEFIIRIPSDYDYQYEAFDLIHRDEIIHSILKAHKKSTSTNFKLLIHEINVVSLTPFKILKSDSNTKRIKKVNSTKLIGNTYNLFNVDSDDDRDDNNEDGEVLKILQYYSNQKNENNLSITVLSPRSPLNRSISIALKRDYMCLIEDYISLYTARYIPLEIKYLIIEYLYKSLICNEYIDVHPISTQIENEKISIKSSVNNKFIRFGGRVISKMPINKIGSDNNKITINVINTFSNYDVNPGELKVIAIDNYDAVQNGELNIKQSAEYVVIEGSESGWWCIKDIMHGDVGWAPSKYFKRCDDEICAIGITSNREAFLNGNEDIIPFQDENIKSSVWWINNEICSWSDGVKSSQNLLRISRTGDNINISMNRNHLEILHQNKCISSEYLKRYDDDGNEIDYYFAMVFSISTKVNAEYEISGNYFFLSK